MMRVEMPIFIAVLAFSGFTTTSYGIALNPEQLNLTKFLQDDPEEAVGSGHSKRSTLKPGDECKKHSTGALACQDTDYVCYEDLSDASGIYEDQHSCKLKNTFELHTTCHPALMEQTSNLGTCEKIEIQRRVSEIYNKIPKLGAGSACKWFKDADIMRNMQEDFKEGRTNYRFLDTLQNFLFDGFGLCDATRLLSCGYNGACQCSFAAKQRWVEIDGVDYFSDFCYLDRGLCANDVTQHLHLNAADRAKIIAHYGDHTLIQSNCSYGNVCVFVDRSKGACTDENTRTTGVDVDDPSITPDKATDNDYELIYAPVPVILGVEFKKKRETPLPANQYVIRSHSACFKSLQILFLFAVVILTFI